MIRESSATRSFRVLIDSRGPIDLAEAALLIAKDEYPGLDIPDELARLDALAEEARPQIAAPLERERLRLLCRFLSEIKGFRGNRESYYDPKNSFLNDVLTRRVGIPISLALVYMEVARRLNIRLVGVGFPMHFLLAHVGRPTEYVDAFAGRVLDRSDVARLLRRISNGRLTLNEDMLAPIGQRAILERMLRNLKSVYASAGDTSRLLRILDLLLVIKPESPEEYRDRGAVYMNMRAIPFALMDFERYLKLVGKGADKDAVSLIVAKLKNQKTPLSN